jgi:hypothetical protein
MNAREYAEEQVRLMNAWNAYALPGGDPQSETIVHNDVKKFMREHSETDYNAALKARRAEIRTMEANAHMDVSKFSGADMDVGVELDLIAQRNRTLIPTLSYDEALKLALLENPKLAERYVGRDVRRDLAGNVHKMFTDAATSTKRYAEGKQSPVVIISGIVGGLPRMADGSIDLEAATRAVNAFGGDTLAQAATETLEVLLRDLINQQGVPGSEVPQKRAQLMQQVRRMHPDVARAADGSPVNERALRTICWPLFK